MREFTGTTILESDIPVLVKRIQHRASPPFATHHEALDLDVCLRIALQSTQKNVWSAEFDLFRDQYFTNEGMDQAIFLKFTEETLRLGLRNNEGFPPLLFGTTIVKILTGTGPYRNRFLEGSQPRSHLAAVLPFCRNRGLISTKRDNR